MSIAAPTLRPRAEGSPFGRVVLGLTFVGMGLLLLAERSVFRGVEAAVAGLLSGMSTGSDYVVQSEAATYFINVGTPQVFGMLVTPECSAAIATAAIVMLVGATIAFTGVGVARSLAAGAAAATFFIGINLFRLVIVTYSSDRWGLTDGYRWSHLWAGTAITIFGGTLSVLLFIIVLAGNRSRGSKVTRPQRKAQRD